MIDIGAYAYLRGHSYEHNEDIGPKGSFRTKTIMKFQRERGGVMRRIREKEELRYQEAGKAFIVCPPINGIPAGRRLAKAFRDQFNRLHVMVNGEMELVTEDHAFLRAD